MKKFSISPMVMVSAIAITIILVFISGWLYSQKRSYQQLNRELIIQNDSIISVNMELLKELEQRTDKAGLDFKNY